MSIGSFNEHVLEPWEDTEIEVEDMLQCPKISGHGLITRQYGKIPLRSFGFYNPVS